MPRSLEQKLADVNAKIARLQHQDRKLDAGQKIVLGGMLLNAARQNEGVRKWLLQEAGRSITREVDKKRLAPLLEELSALQK